VDVFAGTQVKVLVSVCGVQDGKVRAAGGVEYELERLAVGEYGGLGKDARAECHCRECECYEAFSHLRQQLFRSAKVQNYFKTGSARIFTIFAAWNKLDIKCEAL
jgi:hypothetical protein